MTQCLPWIGSGQISHQENIDKEETEASIATRALPKRGRLFYISIEKRALNKVSKSPVSKGTYGIKHPRYINFTELKKNV